MIRRYQLRGRRAPVPTISSAKAQTKPIDYGKGLSTSPPNDLQTPQTLQYVTDMRFNGIGKYRTRQGCDHYSVAIGEAVNVGVTSTTGAGDAGITTTTWQAQKITATATGVLSRIDINLKNPVPATGTVVVEVHSDDSGAPGALLATSTIAESDVDDSYGYITAYFMAAPDITNADVYWVVVYLQASALGTMYVSSTTNSTNALTSTDMGQTWSADSYSLNVKFYTATTGGIKGMIRIYRPDGTGITFFAHGTNLYQVDDTTGATTSVDSSINSSATRVRFDYINDVLYYVDEIGKPRKYDFTSSSEVSSAPHAVTNLLDHVGIMFYTDAEDQNQDFFSGFADYETFTSTDFIYVDAPKKSDKTVAKAPLNGALYFFTRRNKYQLLGQDDATFKLDEAYAQKGTFSQESLVYDDNFIYFASDDGVYQFNGTSEKNILESIIDDYTGILFKDDIHLQLHNNRLYIWFRPNGQAEVNQCIVYNTLYGIIEGIDTNTYVGRSFARHDTTDKFLQASNRAGVIYYSEQASNDYHNLGSPFAAEVRTSYDHFGSPQQLKRIRYWRPLIEATSGNYTLQAGFAADYSDDANFTDVPLQAIGYKYDDDDALYDAATYADGGTSVYTPLNIYGSAYRWQRRYKHFAAHEPIEFAGEVLSIQTMRLR